MALPNATYDFAALSIADLLEARDLYHLHLLSKTNVVGTAVGYYRIRKQEQWPTKSTPKPDNSKFKEFPRTLANSEIRPYSWPAILVFVEKMVKASALASKDPSSLIPKAYYLPNGKAVPVCVIEAPSVEESNDNINFSGLNFPTNVISGGFPLLVDVQNQQRVASFGCLVTDGHSVYALTNRHVAGKTGTPISTILDGREQVIGYASELQLNKVKFSKAYPWFKSENTFVNVDIGLIEVIDVNQWKAEIYGIGKMEPIIDLNQMNLTLRIINQPVVAFGSVSGEKMEGEIQALFYRYRSINGLEYVSDFLIGPRTNGIQYSKKNNEKSLTIKYGDSGTIVLLEDNIEPDVKKKPIYKYHPIGVIWGMHQFASGVINQAQPYILASSLSNACRLLDLEIIRDWNLDQVDTWGEIGHFKVGAKACELVTTEALKNLLTANIENIGYKDDTILNNGMIGGKFTHDFVPLADVADIIWRSTRPADSSNHFADVDEQNEAVFGGKSLLELSVSDDQNIDVDFWLEFDKQMDEVDPRQKKNKKTNQMEFAPRRGALPFRVWQMYIQMIKSLSQGNVLEFIVAGGTMSHYVGDACQPLHISYLHHGRDASEYNVHGDYETQLLAKKTVEIFTGVNQKAKNVKKSELIGASGINAAKLVLELMKSTITTLPPMEVLDSWLNNKGRGKYDGMWSDLGEQTTQVIADGSHALAILWESAWKHGGGDQIPSSKLKKLDPTLLQNSYNTKTFVQSFTLDDTQGYKSVLA